MAGYINVSGNYKFDIGIAHVLVKSNARTVRARWKGGALHVTAPVGIPYDELQRILREFAPKLQSFKPEAPYYIGQHFDFVDLQVDILSQSHVPDKMYMSMKGGKGVIEVGENWDMEAAQTIKTISKMLCRMAQSIAEGVLLPRAKEVAARLNVAPSQWTISNGHRTLGHCSSQGVIALSYALIFYPLPLRDYVICHELAHLSEMSHSPRFHQICDAYCGGKEKELVAAVRAFKLPIIR